MSWVGLIGLAAGLASIALAIWRDGLRVLIYAALALPMCLGGLVLCAWLISLTDPAPLKIAVGVVGFLLTGWATLQLVILTHPEDPNEFFDWWEWALFPAAALRRWWGRR